jgi:hypothetical protein
MPNVTCPACGSSITLPFPWNFPACTCPRCSHVVTGRRARALHLRYLKFEMTAATAAKLQRLVPLVSAKFGRKVTREEFFALAVAALEEKCATDAPKSEDTSEMSALDTCRHIFQEKENCGTEATAQSVACPQ